VEAFMRLVLRAPVEDELLMVGNTVGSIALVGSLGLVLAVAALTYRFVEEPARRIGRTWLDSAEPAREPRPRVNAA
jgi:peptidoglycan/LPS O-acetylase OafA/YrhL